MRKTRGAGGTGMSIESLFDGQDMTGLAASIRDGDVSAREVVEFALHRIAERNPAVNAVIAERAEEALAEVDAGLPDGPAAGNPLSDQGSSRRRRGASDVQRLPAVRGSGRERGHRTGVALPAGRARGHRQDEHPEFGQNASTEPVLFGPTRNRAGSPTASAARPVARARPSRSVSPRPRTPATAVVRSGFRRPPTAW